MLKTALSLTSLLFVTLTSLHASDARDHLSPHQRAILESKSPSPEEYRFGFDLPAGPQFTEAEKEAQRELGKGVMPMVMKAFEAGAESVTLAPGDYRFGQERWQGAKVIFPLGFENMQRDAAHPFVIDATGATFWFDLDDKQMPPGHRCVGFRNCRNLVLRGAIIDRGTRGCIEGRITRIDREGNRFEIQPSPGVVVPTSYKGADEQRLFPFKSDGRFCVPLYDMQAGVRKLRYKDITPSEGGRYWVNMLEPQLMERLHDANWERAYGDLGVVRVGDGLSCLYTGTGAIVLDDSANITLHGVSVYVAKGGPSESGGDGAHLWKDCYFGPRPGSSQWKGADGFLCRSTRYGCVMDNVTIRHTADDLQNFHGIWGKVKSVSGKQVTLETNGALLPTLRNARAGDRLRFIHRKNGALLGEAKLISHQDYQLTLDQDATPFAEAQAEWLDHECGGWVVQNCRWEDNFQRLLIMSGPGLVRGCTFTRMGSNISLNTGMGLVGGIPSDITITDNTFIDVSSRPHNAAIEAHAHNAQGGFGTPPIERLIITGNTITRSGGPAMNLIGIQDSRIETNVINSPVRATLRATLLARPNDEPDRQAILLRHSTRVTVKGNTLTDPENHTQPDATSKSRVVGLDATKEITLDGQKLRDTPARAKPRGKK
ncbi:MAG: right-handed parallel beta-helix repeat-containing protein [Verrucomicrobiaceae bacterium]|nr:right-handed parallel beta-helix repeat-containing protein [Verrucomicrobiaceae bacterium]